MYDLLNWTHPMGHNQARKENKMVQTIKEVRQEVLGHFFTHKSAGYKA